ncbi:hypothetical protein [Paraburkholderia caballeronis]|uniref:hypothetical protein n=1 Tax=Paraburkholderia caballeronis TaxID=416943 RepID=UPI00115FB5B6|nr:hypothetical protein [Paraburkholderia caballeronis]
MKQYPSFRDWFLVGIAVEAGMKTVAIVLHGDNKGRSGATGIRRRVALSGEWLCRREHSLSIENS